MNIKKNILKNTGAGIISKFSNTAIRLLQVPLLIYFLGVTDFGRWTVLYTIPSWLAFTNLGFGSAGANQMSMFIAEGGLKDARKVFSTTIAIITFIVVAGSLLVLLIAPFISWELFLKTDVTRHNEIYLSVIWMSITVFISFYNEAFLGIFRAAHKAHYGVLLSSMLPWFNLLGMFIIFQFTTRFDYIALSLLFTNVIFLVIYAIAGSKTMPELSFSFKLIQPNSLKYLFRKGFAFQAFPVGNALVIQGNIIIVQFILGPVAVATYSTAKTLVNTVRQVLDIIAQASWPELSHLFGAKDMNRAAFLHRKIVSFSILFSILGVLFLTIFGQPIYSLWIGKSIQLPFHLLLLFLLPLPFTALWFTSSIVHMASNNHEKLALWYLIAAIISLFASLILTYIWGINGAAVSAIILDVILIPFVIRKSIELTEDTRKEFIESIISTLKENPFLIIKKVLLNKN